MVKKMLMAGVVTALFSASAMAATIVDLRFASGDPKSKNAAAGTYDVNVFVDVTGADALSNEALQYVMGSIQSGQVNGGVLIGGGVSGNAGVGLFTTAAPNGQPGTVQNLSVDGVADWGTTASNNANTIKYNSTLNNGLDFVTTGTPITNGVEFLVGTFQVTIGAADLNLGVQPGAATTFNWVKGTGTIPNPHSTRLDGATSGSAAASAYSASAAANGVSFVAIPEPGSIALLGLGALGVLARRRRA